MKPAEHEYVTSTDDFDWIPGAREALRGLARMGYVLTVVSNQRGVARGLVSREALESIEQRIQRDLALAGGTIERFRYCFHNDEDGCACRKPRPGMILSLAEELDIDLAESWVIGDTASDVAAGKAAGCRTALVGGAQGDADVVAVSLVEASHAIAADSAGSERVVRLEFLDQSVIGRGQPLIQSHLGSPAELLERSARVHTAALQLSGAQRRQLTFHDRLRLGSQQLEDVGHRRLDAGRDVEDAGLADGGEERLRHVVHVDVVACGLAETEEGRGGAAPQSVAEDRDDTGLAVRTLARAVHVPQSANRVGDAGSLPPGGYVCLSGPFGGAVGRDRGRQRVLGSRQRRPIAVQCPARRGEDDRRTMPRGRLQDVQRSADVDRTIAFRIGDGTRDARLCREVEDHHRSCCVDRHVERACDW